MAKTCIFPWVVGRQLVSMSNNEQCSKKNTRNRDMSMNEMLLAMTISLFHG